MTEIKKLTKIAILAYGGVSLIFGIMLVFLTDIFLATLNMPTWQNPVHPRMFGAALFIVTIFALLVLLHKDWDWEKIKLSYEVLGIWLPINIIVEVSLVAVFSSVFSTAATMEGVMDIVIMSVLLVLIVVAYIKQRG